jgi:hypothetical protein
MDIITREEIAVTEAELKSYTESDIRKMMKRYQKKQTALLVYAAAVAEREQLNDEEYDVLISASLLAWQTIALKCPSLKKVRIEKMEELDNRLFEDLSSQINQSAEENEEFIQETIFRHAQPNLLGRISELSMETEDGVREDLRGVIFFAAKNVLDALIDACEQS